MVVCVSSEEEFFEEEEGLGATAAAPALPDVPPHAAQRTPALPPLLVIPRPPTHIPLPWDPAEDLVLSGTVYRATLSAEDAVHPPQPQLSQQQQQQPPQPQPPTEPRPPVRVDESVWQLVSDALAAGATSLSVPLANQAMQVGCMLSQGRPTFP